MDKPTVGQVAYERWMALVPHFDMAWDQLPQSAKDGWEEIAQVAIDHHVEQLKAGSTRINPHLYERVLVIIMSAIARTKVHKESPVDEDLAVAVLIALRMAGWKVVTAKPSDRMIEEV